MHVRTLCVIAAIEVLVAVRAHPQTKTDVDKQWEETKQKWTDSARQQEEQRQAEIAAKSPPGDPFKWAQGITNLNAGRWEPLGAYDDGKLVLYVTRKDAMRQGNVATVWFRNEWRDLQANGPIAYRSGVEREQFDCVARTTRVIAEAIYSENSLGGETRSFTHPNNSWEPVVPGTRGEEWINWACKLTRPKKSDATTK